MFCLEILSLLHIINRTQTNLPVVSLSGYEPRQNLCIESTFRTTGNTLPHSVQRNDSLWCLLESHWKCTCFMWLCKDSVWKGNCSKPIHTETTEGSCGLVVAASWIWLAACTLHWRKDMSFKCIGTWWVKSPNKVRYNAKADPPRVSWPDWAQLRVDTTLFSSSNTFALCFSWPLTLVAATDGHYNSYPCCRGYGCTRTWICIHI